MDFATNQNQPAKPVRQFRRLAAVVVVGGIFIAAAVFVRTSLFRASSAPIDPTPLEREKRNAPFITSPYEVVDKMVEVAELTEDDVVYDLGCGDGRIVITAVLKTGCHGIGFDIDPKRVAEATENSKLRGVEDRVTIKEQDIFKLDLSQTRVVMMYLLPWMMNDLVPQFEQMNSGSRIVSHQFYIEDVEPQKVIEVFAGRERERHFIYLYTVPLKWKATRKK